VLYYISLGIGALLFWLAWNVIRHRPGRAMRALGTARWLRRRRESTSRATDVGRLECQPFTQGVAGSLYGLTTGFVSPDTFPVEPLIPAPCRSGDRRPCIDPGAFAGRNLRLLAADRLEPDISDQTWVPSQISEVFVKAGPAVTYGALLILIMIFAPTGMVGLITSAYGALRKRLWGP